VISTRCSTEPTKRHDEFWRHPPFLGIEPASGNPFCVADRARRQVCILLHGDVGSEEVIEGNQLLQAHLQAGATSPCSKMQTVCGRGQPRRKGFRWQAQFQGKEGVSKLVRGGFCRLLSSTLSRSLTQVSNDPADWPSPGKRGRRCPIRLHVGFDLVLELRAAHLRYRLLPRIGVMSRDRRMLGKPTARRRQRHGKPESADAAILGGNRVLRTGVIEQEPPVRGVIVVNFASESFKWSTAR